jgi:hypothetical protein
MVNRVIFNLKKTNKLNDFIFKKNKIIWLMDRFLTWFHKVNLKF